MNEKPWETKPKMHGGLTPHGPGFRFVDRFEGATSESGVGWKHLNGSEPFFTDHFPGQPLMPAVLLVECAAQAAGVLLMKDSEDPAAPLFLASIDQFRVLGPVVPGDTLETEVAVVKVFGELVQVRAECRVRERPVARGLIVLSRKLSSQNMHSAGL
jgi:3-hydroxymyristoyl/3-hydroxydecanoyl-(acyl carrier protein) dehydratase